VAVCVPVHRVRLVVVAEDGVLLAGQFSEDLQGAGRRAGGDVAEYPDLIAGLHGVTPDRGQALVVLVGGGEAADLGPRGRVQCQGLT
jgi:hypothetical protein